MATMKICIVVSAWLAIWAVPGHGQDLRDIYRLALENDPALKEMEQNRNAALEMRPQSLARLLPSLSIVGSLNTSRYDTTNTYTLLQFGAQEFWDSNVSLRLSQPLYHHEYWVQLSQTENQVAQAEAEFEAEQQNVFMKVAKAYFAVLLAQDNQTFANQETHSLGHQLKQAQQRFAVGAASMTDVQEAQAGFDQAEAARLDAGQKLQIAESALAEIIGIPGTGLARLGGRMPLADPAPNRQTDWETLATQNNLTVIAATHHTEAAKKNVELQFSAHLPSLDMVGNLGVSDTDRPAGLVANSQVIGVQLNVPLFQGGAVSSKTRQASHQYAAAQYNLDKQRRAALKQAQDAYKGVLFSVNQIKALESAQNSSAVAVEAAEKGMAVGTRTMADVLAANRNVSKARRDHAQARYDYILTSLQLKQAAGTLGPNDLEAVNQWLSEK